MRKNNLITRDPSPSTSTKIGDCYLYGPDFFYSWGCPFLDAGAMHQTIPDAHPPTVRGHSGDAETRDPCWGARSWCWVHRPLGWPTTWLSGRWKAPFHLCRSVPPQGPIRSLNLSWYLKMGGLGALQVMGQAEDPDRRGQTEKPVLM